MAMLVRVDLFVRIAREYSARNASTESRFGTFNILVKLNTCRLSDGKIGLA